MTNNDTKPRVAFIGLGAMGYPMAARLAGAGFPLAVFDVAPGVGKRFCAEFTAQDFASAADAAAGADFVITMLPSSKEVEATLLGAGSIPAVVDRLEAGATVIDMSSSEPLRTRILFQTLAGKNLTLVDAPVSGGVKKARDGSLAIMVGGSEASLEHCRPVLESMGTKIFHTGEVGSGHAMKALNNFVSAAGLVATVEALHIGEKFGLDPATMTRVLNASTGKNHTTENKVEQFMLSGAYNSSFGLALMAKDVGIAVRLAEALGAPVRQGSVCSDMWNEAAEATKGVDHTEMYRLLS